MVLKKSLQIIILIISLVFGLTLLFVVKKLSYKYLVDYKLEEKLHQQALAQPPSLEIFKENTGKSQDSIIRLSDSNLFKASEKPIETISPNGSKDVSFEHLVEYSSDNGKTWSVAAHSQEGLCDLATQDGLNLLCISTDSSEILLNIINDRGLIKHKKLSSSIGISDLRIVSKDDKKIYLVWVDERAKFPTIWAFLPIPNSALPYKGPDLTMAGELNLDTLEFKESVIKYNSSIWP